MHGTIQEVLSVLPILSSPFIPGPEPRSRSDAYRRGVVVRCRSAFIRSAINAKVSLLPFASDVLNLLHKLKSEDHARGNATAESNANRRLRVICGIISRVTP